MKLTPEILNFSKLDFILLIPCCNNIEGLIRSINSVNYPTNKFEILIIDDGSLLPILMENFIGIKSSVKIQIIRIFPNEGILNALNTGLKELKDRNDFKYVARLDAGDVCHPQRFIKQIQFLEEHPEVFLLGTWCRFEERKTLKGYNYISKTEHAEILREMHFKCSFIHPTVLFRKEVLDSVGFYPEGYPHAEDYAYFWQILKKFRGAILPEILVNIECLSDNISAKNYKKQLRSRMKVVKCFGIDKGKAFLGLFFLVCRFLMPSVLINNLKSI